MQESPEQIQDYVEELFKNIADRDESIQDACENANKFIEHWEVKSTVEARAIFAVEYEAEHYYSSFENLTVPVKLAEKVTENLDLKLKSDESAVIYTWSKYRLVVERPDPKHREDEHLCRFVLIDEEKGDQIECSEILQPIMDALEDLIEDKQPELEGEINYNSHSEKVQYRTGHLLLHLMRNNWEAKLFMEGDKPSIAVVAGTEDKILEIADRMYPKSFELIKGRITHKEEGK